MKMTIIIVRKLVLLIFPSFSTISGEPHISFFPCFHFQLIYQIYFHLRVLFSPQKSVSCVQWLLCDVCRSDLFQGLTTGLNSLSDQLRWVLSFSHSLSFTSP